MAWREIPTSWWQMLMEKDGLFPRKDSMHASAHSWASRVLEGKTFGTVIEFGSRNVNGAIRPAVHSLGYVGIDIKPGPDVDVVADAADYRGKPVDLVICMETLEHAPNWPKIVKSASENLLVGGWFLMTCAGPTRMPHSAVDGGPLRAGEYYQNISAEVFIAVAVDAGLKISQIETRPQIGDLYALTTKL